MLVAVAAALAAPPNVVLITLDTTRADALSCYGIPPGPYRHDPVTTPHLDALAAEGARFAHFFAQAPSTLSSHASLLTGLDPHGHGIVRNGFPLPADLHTLPERLRDAGYDTIAAVGSAALEASMGLDRGFRVYDDHLPDDRGRMIQAPADDVVARALAAVDARPDPAAPLLLWAHFYDPHSPYTPPPAFAARTRDPAWARAIDTTGADFVAFAQAVRHGRAAPQDIEQVASLYLAEVAFVDEQVQVLLDALRGRGLLDHTLVVVVGDHGETLADDPVYAWSHGSNTALEVMHVPLIVRGYGLPIAQRAVIERQAGASHLAPTIEALVGLEPSLGAAVGFEELLRAGPVRDEDGWPERPTLPVFVEATRPRLAEADDGWNNRFMHRGVFAGGYGAFRVPFLDWPTAPYEWGPLPDADVLDLLQELVADWDAHAPAHSDAPVAPRTEAALKALGYTE
ncbi:MAG: sulfatase [Myxococcota bacterium]